VAASAARSLVLFSQELLALLTAGLGIVEGLEALLEKEANPATRGVLERLLAGLREGQRFSAVLAEQPDLFPPLYVGIVKAAEAPTCARAGALHRLPAAHRPGARQAGVGRHLSVHPAAGGRRRQPVPDRLCGAALSPSVPGRRPQPAVAVAADAELGPVRRRPHHAAAGRDRRRAGRAGSACAAAGQWRHGAPAGKLPGIGERVRIYELSRLYLTLGMLSEGGITIVHAIDTVQGMVSPAMRANLQRAPPWRRACRCRPPSTPRN
jgi:general secretion pathway protein F